MYKNFLFLIFATFLLPIALQAKPKTTTKRTPTHFITKEEILGKDYYKAPDSKKLRNQLNGLLAATEGVCVHKGTAEIKYSYLSDQLTSLHSYLDHYLSQAQLESQDRLLLSIIQTHTPKEDYFYKKDMDKHTQRINMFEMKDIFQTDYGVGFNREVENGNYPESWARQIYKAISCVEKNIRGE